MDFFRIDCSVPPFAARAINDQQFVPVFDNATAPSVATGLAHIGQCTDAQLARYAGVPCFEVTRLGPDAATAEEANDAIEAERAAVHTPVIKSAPVKAAPKGKGKATDANAPDA